MRRSWTLRTAPLASGAALATLLVGGSAGSTLATAAGAPSGRGAWDRLAAERYLDGREVWWQSWDRPHKDRATLCVSCHTQASYSLARPILRQDLAEPGPSGAEQAMLASVEKRVSQWSLMQPFYSDLVSGPGKEVESRNAEAVLNAFILASYDARQGHLRQISRKAFDNAWALQTKHGPDAGSWVWQNFGLAPWESRESRYHWAALMAVAVAKAPDRYRDDPKIASNLDRLTAYLRRHHARQPLLNQVVALWATPSFPTIMTAPARAALIDRLGQLQRPDGGWSLTDLGPWRRVDSSSPHAGSDGYATAITVLVLEQIGQAGDPRVERGLDWLVANQDRATGAWKSWSVNKNRDAKSDAGPFMDDAATAYAVVALEDSDRKGISS
jgi:hypothetical protein